MTVSQSEFRAAVLDPQQQVPSGLVDAKAAPAGARFDVYRNNVVLSLSDALATAFPLVRKLLGGPTFEKLASVFVRQHPPTSPLMMFYGAEMPDFLSEFQPLTHVGYLSDCARLDLAQRHAYHAADTLPFQVDVLQRAETEAEDIYLSLAPATTIIRSPWPLYDIWRFNTQPDAPKPRAGAQDVLVTRPQFDPEIHLLPDGGATWLQLLHDKTEFGQAYEDTLEMHPSFDLAEALGLIVASGALAGQDPKEDP